jgi:hypothetical protein
VVPGSRQPLKDHPDKLFLAMAPIERAFNPTGARAI